MTFTRIGEHQLIIDHTEVPDVFRGQGVGLKLVARAVDDARKAGKTIIPLCPFAAAQFRRRFAANLEAVDAIDDHGSVVRQVARPVGDGLGRVRHRA